MPKQTSQRFPQGLDGALAEALGRGGVLTTEDAARWGVGPAALSRAVKKGRVVRLLPRVYAVGGSSLGWWTYARAATVWSAGALSHLSAAFSHGLIEEPPEQIDIVAATWRKAPPDTPLRCHRSRLVGPPHVVNVRGISTTAPARTLLDMAPEVSDETLEAALEDALRRGLVSMARVEWQLRTEGRKGRPGTVRLRKILESRGPGVAAMESVLETKVARWFRGTSLPQPVRQHRVVAEGRFIARVDFAYPQAKVAVEALSYRWHSGRRAWLRDTERQRNLRALGWQIIELTKEDLTQGGGRLEAEIAAALGVSLF